MLLFGLAAVVFGFTRSQRPGAPGGRNRDDQDHTGEDRRPDGQTDADEGREEEAARHAAERVSRVKAREDRALFALFRDDRLHVHRDVGDAQGAAEKDDERGGEPDVRREGERHDEDGHEREARAQHRAATPAGDEPPGHRHHDERTDPEAEKHGPQDALVDVQGRLEARNKPRPEDADHARREEDDVGDVAKRRQRFQKARPKARADLRFRSHDEQRGKKGRRGRSGRPSVRFVSL